MKLSAPAHKFFTMNILFPIILILLNQFATNSLALDLEKLEDLGIKGDFYVSDIEVYFNRVFLAIPRTVCQNNITTPTLVEVPWKEFNVILKIRFNKPIEGQLWANCDNLQNAISLAKEGVKSKLWILDKGNEFCPAKIMAYGMFQNAFLSETIELGEMPKDGLSSMVIENSTKLGNHRAFIANAGQSVILVCYLKDLSCDHLKVLEARNQAMPIRIDFLALSETGSKMYLTGTKSTRVFALNLYDISEKTDFENSTSLTVNVDYLGEKLGPSSGLNADLRDGLIYYLTRDYAVVRWMIGKPMQAEYHDVLAQSFKRLPYVSRFFTDPQGSVYALVNPFNPFNCEKEENDFKNNSATDEGKQLERVVKIMKYNRLLEKFF